MLIMLIKSFKLVNFDNKTQNGKTTTFTLPKETSINGEDANSLPEDLHSTACKSREGQIESSSTRDAV